MSQFKSKIYEHNRYEGTDRLYDPLREVIQTNSVSRHEAITPYAARSSHLSHNYRIMEPQQINYIGKHLYSGSGTRAQSRLEQDATEKIVGEPITPQQMRQIKSRGVKEERVLYDYGEPHVTETIVESVERKTKYRSPPLDMSNGVNSYERKKNNYKYNLYSIIDEPINNCRQGKSCTCPGNEVIAQRNQPQSMNWLK